MSSGLSLTVLCESVEFECHSVAKRNQSTEDLNRDHYHGGDISAPLEGHCVTPVECFDSLLPEIVHESVRVRNLRRG